LFIVSKEETTDEYPVKWILFFGISGELVIMIPGLLLVICVGYIIHHWYLLRNLWYLMILFQVSSGEMFMSIIIVWIIGGPPSILVGSVGFWFCIYRDFCLLSVFGSGRELLCGWPCSYGTWYYLYYLVQHFTFFVVGWLCEGQTWAT